ncbi:hypothetical protein PCANC_00210 [Puccinia coronata f. sp. avenae]|uniref:Uncharacterized protein n=1 Tax=Puccinia coronata f. sp. avenae TaxID=200324 RepID=A0A2N5W990_9BASI|nr:hypothetical protein PCANC_28005 [Puccinia coronata f. sp. avenae]PLW58814.1 hypothetical protein PCANC_00210 [Puccinia coronata f. sp. avenae]
MAKCGFELPIWPFSGPEPPTCIVGPTSLMLKAQALTRVQPLQEYSRTLVELYGGLPD